MPIMDSTQFHDSGEVRYPWQITVAPWASGHGETDAQRRRKNARSLFEIEEAARCELLEHRGELSFDEKAGFYRFWSGPKKGRFALSEEYADWEGLKEIGYFEAWGL